MLNSVINMAGEKVGEIELADNIFAAPVNEALMHQALVRQLANARLGTAKVKGRSEVRVAVASRGSKRAPGAHARVRSGPRNGGAAALSSGPRRGRTSSECRARCAARLLCSALTVKAAEERIVILDRLDTTGPTPKAREMAATGRCAGRQGAGAVG